MKQASDLSQLKQELNKAFPTPQSQITTLEVSSQTTASSVVNLSTQVDAMTVALAAGQQALNVLFAQVGMKKKPVPNPSPNLPSAYNLRLSPA